MSGSGIAGVEVDHRQGLGRPFANERAASPAEHSGVAARTLTWVLVPQGKDVAVFYVVGTPLMPRGLWALLSFPFPNRHARAMPSL